MGTRGLTKVIDSNGVTKVAQYGQWDHYPAGQGVTILNFLNRDYYSVEELELALDKCFFIDEAEREKIYADYNRTYPDSTHMKKFSSMLPSLSRDTCGDILNVVRWSAGPVPLVDESPFENDSLFCEGVYEVNFQTRQFITKYAGITMEFSLDDLPDQDRYLARFAKLATRSEIEQLKEA
jgi:hypothetical protein